MERVSLRSIEKKFFKTFECFQTRGCDVKVRFVDIQVEDLLSDSLKIIEKSKIGKNRGFFEFLKNRYRTHVSVF